MKDSTPQKAAKKPVLFAVRIEPQQRQRLRQAAAELEMKLQGIAAEAFDEWLSKHEK